MDMVYFLLRHMFNFAVPLLLAALGCMISVRSGVNNIGLDGMMIMGAFFSVYFIRGTGLVISGQGQLLIAILISVAAGIIISVFHAFASINLKANQIISGVAIANFAPAFAVFAARLITGESVMNFNNTFLISEVPVLGRIPIIGDIFFQKVYITTYIAIVLFIITTVVLYKTRFGLRLRSCGENPSAAASVGINVPRMRWTAVLISGALCGLAGLAYVIPNSISFNGTVAGYGFLALAVMIFGEWDPVKILGAAFLFSVAMTLASTYSAIDFLNRLGIPSNFYKMLPYIVTLIIIGIAKGGTKEPKAAGQPFEVDAR